MARLTRIKDEYECRANHCEAEEWMYDIYGEYPDELICESCPFEKYINRLAQYEDLRLPRCKG